MSIDENYTVTAQSVLPSRGTRTVIVECPYCRTGNGRPTKHRHGWPYNSTGSQPGHRLAHCGRGGYTITVGGEL